MNNGQGLSAGNADASGLAHSGVLSVDGQSDHTFCPAVAKGYGGYTSTPFSGGHTTFYDTTQSHCGYGMQAWSFNAGSSYYHGATYNPNVRTFDTFSYAEWYW